MGPPRKTRLRDACLVALRPGPAAAAGLPRLDASLFFVRLFILFIVSLFRKNTRSLSFIGTRSQLECSVLQLEKRVCQKKKKELEKLADLANQRRWTGSITIFKRVYLPISTLVFFLANKELLAFFAGLTSLFRVCLV